MSDKAQSGTAEGLLEVLEWAGRTGEMALATTKSYASAVTKVMEIEGDGWEQADIRGLDVESLLRRFQNLKGTHYQSNSIATYQGRFRKSVELYLAFLDGGPAAIRPLIKDRDRRPADPKPKPTNGDTRKNGSHRTDENPPPPPADDLVTYLFPMRSGEMAQFRLPRVFPSSEVKRMTGFLESLAIDEPRALNPAPAAEEA